MDYKVNMPFKRPKSMTQAKHWLLGFFAALLLVSQSSSIIHDFDIDAHTADTGCEICDLLLTSTEDLDAATSTVLGFAELSDRLAAALRSIALSTVRQTQLHIRAPPRAT